METQTQLPPQSTNDTPIQESLLELSPAEQQALDAAKAEVDAANVAAPAPAAADAAAAAPVADANAAAPAAAPAPATEEWPDVSVPTPTVGPTSLPVPAILSGEAPKFADQLAALSTERDANDKAYDEQTIDAVEFRKRDRDISRREQEVLVSKATFETQQRTQQAFIDQANKAAADAWTSDYQAFMGEPRNAALFKSRLHFDAFQGAINAVEDQVEKAKQSPLLNHTLLERARALYLHTLGIPDPAAAPAPASAPPPPPARKAPQDAVPQTLSAAPAAAPAVSDDASIDALAAKHINDIEADMVRMSPADLDKLLRKLPGATSFGTANE